MRGGYVYSRGYVYCFFPNVPGATFIQGGTFIPDSRVLDSVSRKTLQLKSSPDLKLKMLLTLRPNIKSKYI